MSHWRLTTMVDGAELWISCKRLKLLRKADRLQLIQNLAPSVARRRQCDIRINFWDLSLSHIVNLDWDHVLWISSMMFNLLLTQRHQKDWTNARASRSIWATPGINEKGIRNSLRRHRMVQNHCWPRYFIFLNYQVLQTV